MKKRKWSAEQKIEILKEAQKEGIEITLRKHGLYPATYYSWKKKHSELGPDGFIHGMNADKARMIKTLEKEVAILKKLLAEKDLQAELKDQLLKKKYPEWKR